MALYPSPKNPADDFEVVGQLIGHRSELPFIGPIAGSGSRLNTRNILGGFLPGVASPRPWKMTTTWAPLEGLRRAILSVRMVEAQMPTRSGAPSLPGTRNS